MSNALRTNLATKLLTCTLPDGDVAAEMLMSAEIDTPVKMKTPPNPARCQQLIRGPFAKAATLAMSTDDPDTLEKLAKHAALGVKLAVVKNPAATDKARRIVETAALKRTDSEMLEGVLEGVRIGYVLEALEDITRAERIIACAMRTGKLTSLLCDLENPVDGSVYERLLAHDPIKLAETVGKAFGAMRPSGTDPMYLASICANDPMAEARFLSSFISRVSVFDDKAAEALERIAVLRPDVISQSNTSVSASLSASEMTERGRQCLLSSCLGTAKAAYGIEQSVEILEYIAKSYGTKNSVAAAAQYSPTEENRQQVAAWLISNLDGIGDDYDQMTLEFKVLEWLIPCVEDEVSLVKVLKKAPRSVLTSCLTGKLGSFDAQRCKLLAREFPADVLRQMRHVSDVGLREDLTREAFSVAEVPELLANLYMIQDYLNNEMIVDLIKRVAATPELSEQGRISSGSVKALHDVLQKESFVEYIDSPETDTDVVLWWLRLARSRELTISCLAGRRNRKLDESEVAELLQNPGDSFGVGLNQALVRFFEEFSENLPREVLHKVVDASGNQFLAQVNLGQSRKICEYLAQRLTDANLDNEEWMTAFELIAKNPTSVGAAVSAAKRLVRASRYKQGS